MLEGIVCGLVMGCGDQAAGIQLGVSCRDNRGNREVGEIREVELVQPWVLHSSPNPPTTTPREHGVQRSDEPLRYLASAGVPNGASSAADKPVGGPALAVRDAMCGEKLLIKMMGGRGGRSTMESLHCAAHARPPHVPRAPNTSAGVVMSSLAASVAGVGAPAPALAPPAVA